MCGWLPSLVQLLVEVAELRKEVDAITKAQKEGREAAAADHDAQGQTMQDEVSNSLPLPLPHPTPAPSPSSPPSSPRTSPPLPPPSPREGSSRPP